MWLKNMKSFLRTFGYLLLVLMCGGCFLFVITLLMLSMDGYSFEQNNAFTNLSFSISVPVVFISMIYLIGSFMGASTKLKAKGPKSKYVQDIGDMSKSKIITRFVCYAICEILCIDNVWLITKFMLVGKVHQYTLVFVIYIGFMVYLILCLFHKLFNHWSMYKSLRNS